MLTKIQKKKYIVNSSQCPYCKSEDIEGGSVKIEHGVYQEVWCHKCGKEWVDVYVLVDIHEGVES